MPAPKKFSRLVKTLVTPFEGALLDYLVSSSGRTLGDELRAALRLYARQHPKMKPEVFRKFLRDKRLDEVDDPKLAARFEEEMSAFLESLEKKATSVPVDNVSTFDDRSRLTFSSARAFARDDDDE